MLFSKRAAKLRCTVSKSGFVLFFRHELHKIVAVKAAATPHCQFAPRKYQALKNSAL